MTGYKYNDETSAQLAVTQCNDFYGFPKEGCLTNKVCDYYYYEAGGFYYIEYEFSLKAVLGDPEEFEVTFSAL